MRSHLQEDGRWYHEIRQSWLKTFDLCPERARLEHERPDLRRQSDAAAAGTAVHTAIETAIAEYHSDGVPLALESCIEVGLAEYAEIAAQPDFARIKWASDRGPSDMIVGCVTRWWDNVYATLLGDLNVQLELGFNVPLLEDATRVVHLTGTIDYLHRFGVRDWKTNGRGEDYKEWEYKRWAIQPTVYAHAARSLGYFAPDEDIDFEYVVLSRSGVQRFVVVRAPQDTEWLKHKVLAAVLPIEHELAEWPRMDNHALCSAKWCDHWSLCKGQFA